MTEARLTLDGVLERVVYHNEESAWSVVRLTVSGRPDAVTAVGSFLGVQPGESLRLHGEWTTDRKYGEQFRVASYLTLKPSTLVGIERYLGSGLVQGIGRAMAARLVGHFGLDTLEVIEHHADRLTEVEGIGPVRSRSIREAWIAQREIKDVMVFLQSHGVSTNFAVRIYKRYGNRAVTVVRDNPYQLAIDIHGIGFRTADRIAESLGIPADSPRRAEAGVLHLLHELSSDGHCFHPRPLLVESAVAMLAIDAAIVDVAIVELARRELVIIEAIDGSEAVYLAALYAAERGTAERLCLLCATQATPISVDTPRALAWLEEQQGITLATQQRAAIERAIHAKVLVITGGPGTGKTTIINGIIRILEKKARRILLCAPTGRAAKRMQQATGREARTAHRLLEFTPRAMAFQRNLQHPLDADVVIVDEMSMVDIVLFHHLLKAMPAACQLILVGDIDQLPSVGPGSVLGDVIRSGTAEVVTLTEIFRQAQESSIIVNAHRINRGELPEGPRAATESGPPGDFYILEREEPEKALATVKELVAQHIPRRFGLDATGDIQVLVPMHKGLLGAANLNIELQALLNPAGESIARGGHSFRIGDKVMQIRNNYDLDVYNGDIGRVVAIDDEERQLTVRIDEREVLYEYSDLDELVLAYACSIHKSQGSEYPAVVIPLHTQHYVMLQRNLLYTAVTRGKKLVVLVGSRKAIGLAVRNHRTEMRYTRLAERLKAPTR